MAYNQHNSPYYSDSNYNQQYHSDYPPTAPHAYSADMQHSGNAGSYPTQNGYGYDQNNQSNWDTKSAKSYNTYHSDYADSQAHLNPQYEMTEVPPLPTMGYSQPNYPPPHQLRPQLSQHSSGGWSSAREKLMKRRSVRQVELIQGNLVLDVAVPSHIVPKGAQGEEMSMMRYTAATCDPEYVDPSEALNLY